MYNIFRLYRTEQDWLGLDGQVFLTWAIFNPNGPTFKCVGIRDTGAEGEQEVFYRWMHFLGGKAYCLGYFNDKEEDWPQDFGEILHHAFTADSEQLFGDVPLINCIPSFMSLEVEDEWVGFFRDLIFQTEAMQSADWGRERYYLEKYHDGLFQRAGEETREAYEALLADPAYSNEDSQTYLEFTFARHQSVPSFTDWKPDQYASRRLSGSDLTDWWNTVNEPDFLSACATQWANAWIGGEKMSRMESMMRFEDVRDFLISYHHPIWPEGFYPASGISHSEGDSGAGVPGAGD